MFPKTPLELGIQIHIGIWFPVLLSPIHTVTSAFYLRYLLLHPETLGPLVVAKYFHVLVCQSFQNLIKRIFPMTSLLI